MLNFATGNSLSNGIGMQTNPFGSLYQNNWQPQTVNGIESAKAYPMNPNSRVFLFDTNEDIFYVKETDSSGFATLKIFEFKEVKEKQKTSEPEYVTLEEFNKFKEELLNGKQFIRKEPNGSKSDNKQYPASKGNDGYSKE